jgi:murein tripeptide amidase MpaA
MRLPLLFLAATLFAHAAETATPAPVSVAPPITFNTAFESASLGKIEQLGATEYRLHLKGQQDARGRNRQATWFYFRMDGVAGRTLTLRLTSMKGEYNERPSPGPGGAWYRPVFSEDGKTWQHFTEAGWDAGQDELTVQLTPRSNTVWLAHVPPYTHTRLLHFLDEVRASAHARIEAIGESVQGRPLHLVAVTNWAKPDAGKKVIWMQARQHAWEAGTSFLLEGALRRVLADDAAAAKLRDENIFLFVPMINPDSVVRGDVRFNANGYDPNRQWNLVDLRDKAWLERNPEIWYVKKALLAQHARQPIAFALNLHNTEMNEYLETMVDADPHQAMMHRFFELAATRTSFDPSRPKLTLTPFTPATALYTTSSIWLEAKIPMMLLEQRTGPSRKLGHIATTAERMHLGGDLIGLMAEVAR